MIVCRLDQVAEKRGLNAHQISLQTGVSYPTIHKYWRNQASSYDVRILDDLCKLLECQPGDLLVHISDHPAP